MRLYPLLFNRYRMSSIALMALLVVMPGVARGATDEVLDWNAQMIASILAGGTGPLPSSRVAAIVHAAIFDAVNGIERRYEPIRVKPREARGASARAAAIEAAYTSLARIYPLQAAALLARRNAAIAALGAGKHGESAGSIGRGVEWGRFVANEIWDWRSGDGFNPNPPPPFRGANVAGVWRPTPPANLDGAGPNFASMTPWVLTRPSQFRPGPPPALNSPEYLEDYNEVKDWGGQSPSSLRSADDDVMTVFWTGNTPVFWNRVAAEFIAAEDRGLLNSARRLALINIAMADAAIACWDAKYRYVYWRPVTAITTDDNVPATTGDAAFTSWIVTPNHPDYLSGHSTVSGAAVHVLIALYGDDTEFTGVTEALYQGASIPDRTWPNFSAALDEIHDARVKGGIHFRTACRVGSEVGTQVADYVLRNALRSDHRDHN